jgi:hypothetical protein
MVFATVQHALIGIRAMHGDNHVPNFFLPTAVAYFFSVPDMTGANLYFKKNSLDRHNDRTPH